MTARERAYLAGLMDGEGCVSMFINRWSEQHSRGRPGASTLVRVTIGMCHEPTIRWIERRVGFGNVRLQHRTNAQDICVITWTGRRLTELLKPLLPYLITKREQAEIVLAWIALSKKELRFKGRGGGPAYADWVIAQRDAYLRRMRELNRRGRTPSPSSEM